MKWLKYILGLLGAVGALFAVNKAKSKEVQKLKKVIDENKKEEKKVEKQIKELETAKKASKREIGNMKRKLTMSKKKTKKMQEVYDNADSFGGYDKYLILSNDTIYLGGLGLYEGKTFIDCNGSIINLQDGNGIWVYGDENNTTNLDIQECIITNSLYFGLSYSGESNGNIINCNLVNTNFGLKLFDNANISVNNSIFSSNNSMGIAIYTENPILNISYSLFWNNEDNHLENCPG